MKIISFPVTHYAQNCSILLCPTTGASVLIDPGAQPEVIVRAYQKLALRPEKIWLTHGHADHCAAAADIAAYYGIPIEGPHQADDMWLSRLDEQCTVMGFDSHAPFTPTRWLSHLDTVSFGYQTLDVYWCPGHTPGHVCFVHPQQKHAFVGDVLFRGSVGRTDLPGSNHQHLLASIHNILLPLGEDIHFTPGHGPCSTFGFERTHNPYLLKTAP